jgi:hypothetical protein
LIGKYRGTLLIVISCDTNNKLVPLTFALVERENNDNYIYYLQNCIFELEREVSSSYKDDEADDSNSGGIS